MQTASKTKPFKLDINLDDKEEVTNFLAKYEHHTGKSIALSLGIRGKGSVLLADSLLCYAINKVKAINCREKGFVSSAVYHEHVCDAIYNHHINPVLNAW